jgi:hypothetical protein
LGGYVVLGTMGKGGMGVVYRARHGRTGREVALKTMKRQDGIALDFFKREFRYLQGVSHPNLVQLYDLESDGQDWFLTMELVLGADFLAYVCPPSDSLCPADAPTITADRKGSRSHSSLRALNGARLRAALGQLTEGIAALHAHRRIHRDLKPGNVRVTPEGRVVILDFGLAAVLGPAGEHRPSDEGLMGTVPYMAPEQGSEPPVCSPASDWYSMGVMLYQALTGRLPFTGDVIKLLRDKLTLDPPAPHDQCPDVPEDLDELCRALLRRRPEDRPAASEILARLGRTNLSSGPALAEEAPLLGRETHLRLLKEAYTASRHRRAVVVAVHGPSGIGKSALIGHFLEGLREWGAVVLAGRCYEHERVPYKALDPLVDELARYLSGRQHDEVETLLPRDVGHLVRVFPVLERVGAVMEVAARSSAVSDPQEVRRRAFAALRELLSRLGDGRSLVLHIDDVQWGDIDSAYLLADLLQPPDAPPLLLLLSYRSDDAESPCLRALGQTLARGEAIDWRELTVAPLTEPQTRELVCRLLGDGAELRAGHIAQESGGNPFFITELVQEFRSADGPGTSGPGRKQGTLEGLIEARVGRLPEGARGLLEVLAVSGRPLGELEAYRAAGVEAEGRVLMARLESARFLRGTGLAAEGRLQPYHDRIRETVLRGLAPEPLRAHHRRLACVLEESGRADPEALASHFEGAGESEKAGSYYLQAADRAEKSLAFDQAANLYQKALDLRSLDTAEARALRTKLGDALGNAGRGAEAGSVYLTAAEGAEALELLELRRRASDQLFLAGQTADALKVFGTLLGQVGLRLPGGPGRSILAMLIERARLRLQRLSYRERPVEQIPAEELWRVDACDTAFRRLCTVHAAHSQMFGARQLRLALKAGEPSRIALGLGAEAVATLLPSGTPSARADKILSQALEMAERLDNPGVLSHTIFMGGLKEWSLGHWKKCLELCDIAEALAAERQVSFAGERTKLQHFAFDSLTLLGQWRELDRRISFALQDARRRGDRFSTSTMLVHSYVPCLGKGRPGEAEDVIRQSLEEWTYKVHYIASYWAVYGRAEAALYRGKGLRAREVIRQQWSSLRQATFFQYLQVLFLLMLHLRARAALATAMPLPTGGRFGARARLLRAAARDARRIEGRRIPWATPLAHLIQGGIAALRHQTDEALVRLGDSEQGFAAADMAVYAAAARRQRGRLLSGTEGRRLVEDADACMTSQDIREPARIAAMLAPGFAEYASIE